MDLHHPQENNYPNNLYNMVCFVNIYPLDGDLSGDQHYIEFGKLGPIMSFWRLFFWQFWSNLIGLR